MGKGNTFQNKTHVQYTKPEAIFVTFPPSSPEREQYLIPATLIDLGHFALLHVSPLRPVCNITRPEAVRSYLRHTLYQYND